MIREEDFKQLFYSHYLAMHKLSLNILRDDDLAHDAVQDVFTQLWKKRDQLMFTSTPEAYLKRAVVNMSMNLLKKNKRFVPIENLEEAASEENLKINDKAFLNALENALATLPPKTKAIFVLSRMEGLENREIAEHLEISQKTVENQLSDALKKLREYFSTHHKNHRDLFMHIFF